MFKHKLTYKTLVTAFLLLFTAIEVFPAVMSCVMGSSCGMVSKTKACHKTPADESISSASCCKMMVSNKTASAKEVIPSFSYQVVFQDVLYASPVLPKHAADVSLSVLLPDRSGPPLYLLKQSFLI